MASINNEKEKLSIITNLLEKNRSFYIGDSINLDLVNSIEPASKAISKFVTGTSIRNVYNAFKDIEMKLNQGYLAEENDIHIEGNYEEILNNREKLVFKNNIPIIKLMDGKVNYLINRKKEKTNDDGKQKYSAFYDFIRVSISVICDSKEPREFEAFLKVFECLYAYLEKGSER